MSRPQPDIFNDFLEALEVPHTHDYSLMRFETMSFKSLFGFTHLLADYGIESQGLQLADKAELQALTPPFLAQVDGAFVIVEKVTDSDVTYMSEGKTFTICRDGFAKAWSGIVILAFPKPDAREPGYAHNRFLEIAAQVKSWILTLGVAALLIYLFVTAGLWHSFPTVALTLLSLLGLGVSYLLVLKSLNIHSEAADNVCGVIDKEGCNTVLATDASKFFGLFGWSEVGLTYFSVTLLCLLIFPQYLPYLAAINLCCLPFSFWSVWYQKYRAKAWCTLCLTVQATLWLSFFCYLATGALREVFPLRIEFFVLGLSYLVVLLAINRLMESFTKSRRS